MSDLSANGTVPNPPDPDALRRSEERYTQAFGRPPVTGNSWQRWVEHIHPADRERASEGLPAAVAGADTQWADAYRFRRADGVWAEIEDRPLISRNESGVARRVIGAMPDVTDRKRAEHEIQDREQLLAIVTASARLGLAMVSDEYEYLFRQVLDRLAAR